MPSKESPIQNTEELLETILLSDSMKTALLEFSAESLNPWSLSFAKFCYTRVGISQQKAELLAGMGIHIETLADMTEEDFRSLPTFNDRDIKKLQKLNKLFNS